MIMNVKNLETFLLQKNKILKFQKLRLTKFKIIFLTNKILREKSKELKNLWTFLEILM
jgi:hypothetical protein